MPVHIKSFASSISVNSLVFKKCPSSESKKDCGQVVEAFEYVNIHHSQNILDTFNQLRKENLFTDVILSTCDQEFPCHRAILLSESKYFRAMFCNDHRESQEMLVKINGMKSNTMQILLDYLYTSRVVITDDNVQLLLEASNLFEITPLRNACVKYLNAQLDSCNCLGMREFAETHSLSALFEKANEMISENFEDVVMYEEFLELSKSRLIEYISDDDINVSNEEVVYEAVKRWVEHDNVIRSDDFPELLSYVRLPLIHPSYFVNIIECDEQVTNNPACQNLLKETRKYHIIGNEINTERTRPRRFSDCSVAVVIIGGHQKVGSYNAPYVNAYDVVSRKWVSLSKLPTFTKSEYAVTSFRNSIMVSGGRIHSRDVWLYQSYLDTWMKIAPLSNGRWQHRMATLEGQVYCIGGFDGKNKLRSVEAYDSYSNSWREISPLIFPVAFCGVACCHNKLYVFASDGVTTQCKIQIYNPDTDDWIIKSSLPFSSNFISAETLNEKIYVLDGLRKTIHCYDPLNDKWEESVQINGEKLQFCGMTVCGGKIYVTGGKGESLEASDLMYCYNPVSHKFEKIAKMPRPSCLHGCVTIHRFNAKRD